MNKIVKTIAPLALMASMSANADIVGGTLEASYWYAGPGGDATVGSDSVDFENDLNFDDEGFFEIAASVEHPVPIIPNVKLRLTSLDQEENGTIPAGNSYNGFDSGSVSSALDLSHYDLILYYEILDNWVSVDVGLNLKKFDGEFTVNGNVSSTPTTKTTTLDDFLLLPYAKAELELPFTGMAFGAELAGVSYSDNAVYDARVRIRQNISLAFVELGYRQMAIQLDVAGVDVDADYSGVYLSTGLDF